MKIIFLIYLPPQLVSNDNCPNTFNPQQLDTDLDQLGDACDTDIDGDGVFNITETTLVLIRMMLQMVMKLGMQALYLLLSNMKNIYWQ